MTEKLHMFIVFQLTSFIFVSWYIALWEFWRLSLVDTHLFKITLYGFCVWRWFLLRLHQIDLFPLWRWLLHHHLFVQCLQTGVGWFLLWANVRLQLDLIEMDACDCLENCWLTQAKFYCFYLLNICFDRLCLFGLLRGCIHLERMFFEVGFVATFCERIFLCHCC